MKKSCFVVTNLISPNSLYFYVTEYIPIKNITITQLPKKISSIKLSWKLFSTLKDTMKGILLESKTIWEIQKFWH